MAKHKGGMGSRGRKPVVGKPWACPACGRSCEVVQGHDGHGRPRALVVDRLRDGSVKRHHCGRAR